MDNLFPEFGKIVTEYKNENNTVIVYKIDFPKYLTKKCTNDYDENYEDFKDRMIKIFKNRLVKYRKRINTIVFNKLTFPNPANLTFCKYKYNEIKDSYIEKTKTELIKEYGKDYKKHIRMKDFYKPTKYAGISILLEISNDKDLKCR